LRPLRHRFTVHLYGLYCSVEEGRCRAQSSVILLHHELSIEGEHDSLLYMSAFDYHSHAPTRESASERHYSSTRFYVSLVVRLAAAQKMHGSVMRNHILDCHQKSALLCFPTHSQLALTSITTTIISFLHRILSLSPLGNTIVFESTLKLPSQLHNNVCSLSQSNAGLLSVDDPPNLPPSHNDLAISWLYYQPPAVCRLSSFASPRSLLIMVTLRLRDRQALHSLERGTIGQTRR
jgi:hypothetical protein